MSAIDELEEMLEEYGATCVRKTGKGHELWHLPNGQSITLSSHLHSSHASAARNELSRLKRMLKDCRPVEKPKRSMAPEPQLKLVPPTPPVAETPPGELKFERTRIGWTPEQDKLLLESADAGFSYEEIVDLMKADRPTISIGAVGNRLNKLRKQSEVEPEAPPSSGPEISEPTPGEDTLAAASVTTQPAQETEDLRPLVRDLTFTLWACLKTIQGEATMQIKPEAVQALIDRAMKA